MDARAFDKKKLPSRHVTEGPSRAPHRSYYYAMGLTEEQIHRPFVGVVSCWNEAAPCNIAPGDKYVAKDVYVIGGAPQVMLDGGYLHEDCLTVTGKTIKQNLENVKFNTDQKVVCPVSKPISPTGGVVGLIGIDADKGTLDLEVSKAELDQRRKSWKAPANAYQSGVLRKYADQVGPARKGAVMHAGGKAEVICYADI